MNDTERIWIGNASRYGGSFIMNFALACQNADGSNFPIMKPVLVYMIKKYPLYCAENLGRDQEAIKRERKRT